MAFNPPTPGSNGEHALQERYGTERRARAFYDHQVLDHLNEHMQAFIRRQTLMFIATADARGECDCSLRAGAASSFAVVIDERTLAYPEYRGNGVMASLGNIIENPHIGILFVDFFDDTIGLHVNGRARIAEAAELVARNGCLLTVVAAVHDEKGRQPELWVEVDVEEAYVHCSKHIPMLRYLEGDEAAEAESTRRAGDVFKAKHGTRAWLETPVICESPAAAEQAPAEEPEIGTVRFVQPPARRHTPQPVRK